MSSSLIKQTSLSSSSFVLELTAMFLMVVLDHGAVFSAA